MVESLAVTVTVSTYVDVRGQRVEGTDDIKCQSSLSLCQIMIDSNVIIVIS